MKHGFESNKEFMIYLGEIAGQKVIKKFISSCFVDHSLNWDETVYWLESEGYIEHWSDMFLEFVLKNYSQPLFEEIEL